MLLHIIVCQGLGGEGTDCNGGVRKWLEVTKMFSTLIVVVMTWLRVCPNSSNCTPQSSESYCISVVPHLTKWNWRGGEGVFTCILECDPWVWGEQTRPYNWRKDSQIHLKTRAGNIRCGSECQASSGYRSLKPSQVSILLREDARRSRWAGPPCSPPLR